MTKFIFITDTHADARPMKYHQQKGYPEKLPEILNSLQEFINESGDIDFILHGGDIIDTTSSENISLAQKLFKFSIPVHLCLGNHDLTEKNALEVWMEQASEFFNHQSKPVFSIKHNDCVVHIVPNHWETEPYYWGELQDANLSLDQIEYLTNELKNHLEIPHIVLTHSSIFGLPPEQTGQKTTYHSPHHEITKNLTDLIKKHSNIKCVLGGHNHLNMHIEHNKVHFITGSSFSETPFDFKLFEITASNISMKTISLSDKLNFKSTYNYDKTFVQGRMIDREFEITF